MKKIIIGIDEVGRGSLAGPVCVAAVLVTGNWLMANGKWRMADGKPKGKLRDSKKLSVKQREAWFKFFKNHPRVDYAVARVYPRQIEKINISRAANLAALRAYTRLIANGKWRMANSKAQSAKHKVFLDGGLYLGDKKWQIANRGSAVLRGSPSKDKSQIARTIIRGDEKIKAIATASIIAKVTRDRQMVRLAKKYPRYGFEIHKGYGTKKHLAAIKRYGASEVHRLTFL